MLVDLHHPGPAAVVLKAWQGADQRGPQQLSVCSSGVQLGTVVIRRSGINGCTITPFDLMVEVSIDAAAEALHLSSAYQSRSASRQLALMLSW